MNRHNQKVLAIFMMECLTLVLGRDNRFGLTLLVVLFYMAAILAEQRE